MSKIKNDGLDQYGAEPFVQQQFGTAGVEGVKAAYYVGLKLPIMPIMLWPSETDKLVDFICTA